MLAEFYTKYELVLLFPSKEIFAYPEVTIDTKLSLLFF